MLLRYLYDERGGCGRKENSGIRWPTLKCWPASYQRYSLGKSLNSSVPRFWTKQYKAQRAYSDCKILCSWIVFGPLHPCIHPSIQTNEAMSSYEIAPGSITTCYLSPGSSGSTHWSCHSSSWRLLDGFHQRSVCPGFQWDEMSLSHHH